MKLLAAFAKKLHHRFRLGSKYASVNIILHLAFFRRTCLQKVDEIYEFMKLMKVLPKEK